MLKLQDEKLDIEGRLEGREGKDQELREEVVQLKHRIEGKDAAIASVGQNLMKRAEENERLAEMVSVFKNKLITENCFHTTFAALKIDNVVMKPLPTSTTELTMGFIRDQSHDDEFFLTISTKIKNK